LWLYGWSPQLAPYIISQPVSQSVNAGQPVSFSVTATGIPNPTYQWQHAGTNVPGATSASLTVANPQTADIGSYAVIVSNGAGIVTSTTVTLAVNRPPVPGFTLLGALENTPVSVELSRILGAAVDPDNDAFGLTSVSATSTNGGTVTTNATLLTYSPATDFVGADEFTYTLTDSFGNSSVATVNVTVASTNSVTANPIGVVLVGGDPQVTFAGISGQTYNIQRTLSLVPSDWVTIGSAMANSQGQVIMVDPNPPPGGAYYRTVTP
jgi:Cadherin-like domain/Immunoglobulin domain